jgi:hypothetical protein
MAYVHARKKPGRYGTDIGFVTAYVDGTLTLNGSGTNGGLLVVPIPSPYRRCRFLRGSLSVTTVGADGDGTITATFKKYDASANAAVTISGDINMETMTTREVSKADAATTATDAQLTLDDGDLLELHIVVSSAAVTTDPTNVGACVELAVLE